MNGQLLECGGFHPTAPKAGAAGTPGLAAAFAERSLLLLLVASGAEASLREKKAGASSRTPKLPCFTFFRYAALVTKY